MPPNTVFLILKYSIFPMHCRYLRHKIRTLRGHQNWVKNVEYSRKEQCLATSGFDGAVFLWDINRNSEDDDRYRRKIFSSSGLMRMRLSPLGDRMARTF